ncbi:MAG: helix-hairpin-helix domain-containing protein [Deltaproteobacteria bacterium]|nr:helix-hairpin-helix domain-containing protein [Deltaproteobacteria bacterium]
MTNANIKFDGLSIIVAISVLFYAMQYCHFNCGSRHDFIINGDKRSGPIAVELINHNGETGIYFAKESTPIKKILNLAGFDGSLIINKDILEDVIYNGMLIEMKRDHNLYAEQMAAAKKIALNIPIHINDAVIDDLIAIPGLGVKQAHRIVEYRNRIGKFKAIDDLTFIPGIKGKKLSHLRKYVTLADEKSSN